MSVQMFGFHADVQWKDDRGKYNFLQPDNKYIDIFGLRFRAWRKTYTEKK